MTLSASRVEAVIVARAAASGGAGTAAELVKPLARFAPAAVTPAAWQVQLVDAAEKLRASGALDAAFAPRAAEELELRLAGAGGRSWPQLAERVIPALALGIAAHDTKVQAALQGRDAWAAAIVGRALGLWGAGPPPSLAAVGDALAWRELGLAGKAKRCPPEVRALFVQRQLGTEPGPLDRLVRALAAREVAAPRPELRALRDALVRRWLAGRAFGAPAVFADDVRRVVAGLREGRFGERKVFIAAAWRALAREPAWSAIALDDFKAELLAAQRRGAVVLARADLVAAMDPAVVAASELPYDGAVFHFVVEEPAP